MARSAATLEKQAEKADALITLDPIHDVAVAAPIFSAEPDFGVDDITYPRLKLLQAISPEVLEQGSGLTAGVFYITGDESGRKEITVIPIGYHLSRRYEVGATMEDKVTLCSSSDGVKGVAQAPGGPGGACAVCPLAQWGEDEATGRRILPCQPSYNYICYVPDFGLVALTLARTATNAARTLNGYLKMRGMGNLAAHFTASQVKAPGKIYYVPNLKIVKLSPDDMADAKMLMPN